jgi:transcriptional regulator with XRE-family HTH domain
MSTILTATETEARLADRLRVEREARGWTLADLATRSGVSRAMVSKIERGEASPTAALLGRLSAAFGLTMSQLFARVEAPGESNVGLVTRFGQQPVWRDPETGFLRRSLSPPEAGPDVGPDFGPWGRTPLELVWGELPPGAAISYPAASRTFIADQQLVVIAGDLAITLGTTTHALGAGDCLRFGPPSDVTFHNPGAGRCRYIVAVLRADQG